MYGTITGKPGPKAPEQWRVCKGDTVQKEKRQLESPKMCPKSKGRQFTYRN